MPPYPHMPNAASPATGLPSLGGVWVTYTATGAEGTDFRVPIGQTLPDALYSIFWQPMGMTAIPVLDTPDGAGDRTTTDFRVQINGPLTAGDKIRFLLAE